MGTSIAAVVWVGLAASASIEATGEVELDTAWKNEKNATTAAKMKGDAFKAAFRQASANAVLAALTETVSKRADAEVATSLMVQQEIFENVTKFVTDTQVVSRREDEHGLKVTARASVDTEGLDQQLERVKHRQQVLGRKRVLLAVDDRTVDNEGLRSTTAMPMFTNALRELLKRDGVLVVESSRRFSTLPPTREELDQAGAELGAALALVGTATVKWRLPSSEAIVIPERNERGVQIAFHVRVEFDVELIDRRSGAKYAAAAGAFDTHDLKYGAGAKGSYESSTSDVLQRNLPAVAAAFREQLVTALEQLEAGGEALTLRVAAGQVAALQKRVAALPKVKSVEPGPDGLVVRYAGTPNELATAISRAKGNTLSVKAVKGLAIELEPK